MAALEEAETGDMAAVRRWLLRASEAAPDPAWLCADCGAASAGWAPTCPRCGALGTLEWKAPARALTVGRETSPPVKAGAAGAEDDEPSPALPPGGAAPETPRRVPHR
jgi:HemY protein